MNIHEYQAKELFQKFGVATPPGRVAATAEEAGKIAEELGGSGLVVKAQIHAGGRGKGTFKNGFKGGVHVIDTAAEAQDIAGKHFYRPRDAKALAKWSKNFPKINLVTIDREFGGWAKAQKAHFDDRGTFDQIYNR